MEANPESYLSQAEASDDPDEAIGYLAVAAHAINREAKDNPDRLRELVPELRKAVKSVAKKSKATSYSISVGDKQATYGVEWIVEGPVQLKSTPVPPTSDQALWVAIRDSTTAVSVVAAVIAGFAIGAVLVKKASEDVAAEDDNGDETGARKLTEGQKTVLRRARRIHRSLG